MSKLYSGIAMVILMVVCGFSYADVGAADLYSFQYQDGGNWYTPSTCSYSCSCGTYDDCLCVKADTGNQIDGLKMTISSSNTSEYSDWEGYYWDPGAGAFVDSNLDGSDCDEDEYPPTERLDCQWTSYRGGGTRYYYLRETGDYNNWSGSTSGMMFFDWVYGGNEYFIKVIKGSCIEE
jgi:hypothetical protein